MKLYFIFYINQFLLEFINNKYSKHKTLGYKNAKIILKKYNHTNNLYADKIIDDINCEHVCSQSFYNKKEPMKSDLNILFSCSKRLNSHRQSYKYKTLKGNYTTLDYYGNTPDNLTSLYYISKKLSHDCLFEPSNYAKGSIARSLSYFFCSYPQYLNKMNNVIDKKTILKWNVKHPVKIKDIYWNEVVYKKQLNKNPFITYPILVEFLFAKNPNPARIFVLLFMTIYTVILSYIIKLSL